MHDLNFKIIFLLNLIFTIIPVYTLGNTLNSNDSIAIKSPKGALLRSAILPGWGQFYVDKPVKSILFLSAEVFSICKVIQYNKIYGYIKETKEAIGIEEWKNLPEYDPDPSKIDKRKKVKEITDYDLKMNTWRPREKRNKYSWWCLGVYIFCMLDACVDAHLWNFPINDLLVIPSINENSVGMTLSFSLRR